MKKYKLRLNQPVLCFKIEMINSAMFSGKKKPKTLGELTDKILKKVKTWYFMTDDKDERNQWINILRGKVAAAKGEQFEEDKFIEMEEEELISPDARSIKKGRNYQNDENKLDNEFIIEHDENLLNDLESEELADPHINYENEKDGSDDEKLSK